MSQTFSFGISRKLLLGFAAPIILAILMGISFLVVIDLERNSENHLIRSSDALETAQSVDIEMLGARRREKDFLLFYKDEGFEEAYNNYVLLNQEHTEAARHLLEHLAEVSEELEDLGIETHELEDATEVTLAYDTLFVAVVEGIRTKGFLDNGLEGDVHTVASQIEEQLKTANDVNLLSLYLTMRRHEEDFTLYGNADYVTETQDAAEALQAAISSSEALPPGEKRAVNQLIDDYLTAFTAMATVDGEIRDNLALLRDKGREVQPIIDQLVQAGLQEQERSRDELENIQRISSIITIAVMLGVTIISIILAYLIGRSIVRPLTKITEAAREIAAGDLSRTIDISHQDEIGQLAKTFNQMTVEIQKYIGREATARQNLEAAVEAYVQFVEGVAQGQLKDRLSIDRKANQDEPLIRLGFNLNKMVDGLVDLTQQLEEAAQNERITRQELEDTVAEYVAFVEQVATGKLNERLAIARNANQNEPLIRLGLNLNQMVDGLAALTQRIEEIAEKEREARRNLQATVDEYVAFVEQVAQGNLAQRINLNGNGRSQQHEDQLFKLGDNLNRMVSGLYEMANQTREVSLRIASATSEILAATTQQLSTTTEQDTTINQTSTTSTEVLATVTQTAERAENVARVAQRSVEVSQQGQQVVRDSVDGMSMIRQQVEGIAENILALSEKTQQIGQIIASVNDIAEQSKVLALNASIEAARAGEEGRSFAVVAMEVRNLAEQSREATDQVREILNEIQQATNSAVMATEEGIKGVDVGQNLINKAGETIQELAAVIREAAQAAAQIAASTHQQTVGMDQLSAAMQAIRQSSIQTTASVQQAERSAQDLNAMARQMQDTVSRYTL